MPKLFIHAPRDTFKAEGRLRAASALTELGIECERLADTPAVRAGVWVFFVEHAPDAVFSGGRLAEAPLVAVEVYALQGGLNDTAKRKLISDATSILKEHSESGTEEVPVYVVIREIEEKSWGMYGKQVSLSALRPA